VRDNPYGNIEIKNSYYSIYNRLAMKLVCIFAAAVKFILILWPISKMCHPQLREKCGVNQNNYYRREAKYWRGTNVVSIVGGL
jgi:hypothetical protein